jgi:hypothetical protein
MKQQFVCRHVDTFCILDTSSWFRANQYLISLLYDGSLEEKQQILILLSLIWPDRGMDPRSTTLKDEQANHYSHDTVSRWNIQT